MRTMPPEVGLVFDTKNHKRKVIVGVLYRVFGSEELKQFRICQHPDDNTKFIVRRLVDPVETFERSWGG